MVTLHFIMMEYIIKNYILTTYNFFIIIGTDSIRVRNICLLIEIFEN